VQFQKSGLSARIVLADDHALVRDGLRLLLESIPGLTVIAEASSGEELVRQVAVDCPDLVVTDVSMPGMGGIEAIGRLHGLHPGLPVIVLSMCDTIEVIRGAVASGVRGYVLKSASWRELEHAVRTVIASGQYFSPAIAGILLRKDAEGPSLPLTVRQVEILKLIASGFSSGKIGSWLGLSPGTVDVHRARIMQRLGIHDIAGLTRYAVGNGLLDAVAVSAPGELASKGAGA
jgi:DNA-binding NarL/FixJ family response regulator